MSMDVGSAKRGVKADINVTPLCDVMLVLLIIMMLVAPMLQKGVDVKLPTAANTIDKPDTQVQPTELTQAVVDALEKQTDKVVLIKADQDVYYGTVMDTMDWLRSAGVED